MTGPGEKGTCTSPDTNERNFSNFSKFREGKTPGLSRQEGLKPDDILYYEKKSG